MKHRAPAIKMDMVQSMKLMMVMKSVCDGWMDGCEMQVSPNFIGAK
jgi:hypothetical protein